MSEECEKLNKKMQPATKLTDYEKKTMLIFNWREELSELRLTDPQQVKTLKRLVKNGVLETFIKPCGPYGSEKFYRRVQNERNTWSLLGKAGTSNSINKLWISRGTGEAPMGKRGHRLRGSAGKMYVGGVQYIRPPLRISKMLLAAGMAIIILHSTTTGDSFISTDQRPERESWRYQLEMIIGGY